MTTVVSSLTVSVDGFIADPQDGVGDLFDWYFDGPVGVETFGGPEFRLGETNAGIFRRGLDAAGAFLVGRRLYDHTNGWNGRPPVEAPMVVLTHDPPSDWPRDGVPITFATTPEEAVAEARRQAGDGNVGVAGGATARACLDAGLLDELWLNVTPVVLGDGIPFLAGTQGPVRLERLEVVPGESGMTHLHYRVLRD